MATSESIARLLNIVIHRIECMGSNRIRNNRQLKILLLGDGGVGKTCLRKQYFDATFTKDYHETIGADFAVKKFSIPLKKTGTRSKNISLYIWDVSGQPRFNQVASLLFERADGALIVFDITNQESFQACSDWVNRFMQYGNTNILCVVGNKSDLRLDKKFQEKPAKLVTVTEGLDLSNKLAQQYHCSIPYVETSAKTGNNVNMAFNTLITQILKLISL